MAAFDTSIYQQNPLRSVADYEGDYVKQALAKQAMQQNALALQTGQMGLQDRQRAVEEAGIVRNALMGLGPNATDDQRINALKGTATQTGYAAADSLLKAKLEQDKTRAEVSNKEATTKGLTQDQQIKAVNFNLQKLGSVRTPQEFAAWIDGGVKAGLVPPEEAAAQKAQIPADPAALMALIKKEEAAGVDVKERLTLQAAAARDAETGRSNLAREKNAAGQLDVAQANLGLSRERLNVEKAAPKGVVYEGADGPMLVDPRAGTAVPITAGGVPLGSKADGKPLPAAVTKQLTEVRDNAATVARLSGSFKPEFAGKGVLGMGADAQMMVSGNVGADKDAVEWWKNYRKESELVERHALFGAALTPGEQASWRSADIGPGMNADVVKRNLTTRATLAKKVLENTQADLVDAGHNGKRIGAIAGRGAQDAPPSGMPDMSAIDAELARRKKKP